MGWAEVPEIMRAAAAAVWPSSIGMVNSNFITSIAGALFGAFAGAYGAQRIAAKNKRRDELVGQLRDTNAAITLSFVLCNNFVNFKKQVSKPVKERFDKDKERIVSILSTGTFGDFVADFRNMPTLSYPIETLRRTSFGRLSLSARPLSLVVTLEQTLNALNYAITKRGDLIAKFKAKQTERNDQSYQRELMGRYYRLPFNDGIIDQEYPDTLAAIASQTDNGIFLAELLCQDLISHGTEVAEVFRRKFGTGAPKVNKPDFKIAKEAGLMPPPENYTDWFRAFPRGKS
jgi:hypothetical protein